MTRFRPFPRLLDNHRLHSPSIRQHSIGKTTVQGCEGYIRRIFDAHEQEPSILVVQIDRSDSQHPDGQALTYLPERCLDLPMALLKRIVLVQLYGSLNFWQL